MELTRFEGEHDVVWSELVEGLWAYTDAAQEGVSLYTETRAALGMRYLPDGRPVWYLGKLSV
jgi:hypothetical protein